MRKGRGRVEKTEIIEMAIRHLKNLQTQEVLREATYADHYRSGYNDCVTEAAKFLLRERDEELYYKMITHLREHMSEAMKGESFVATVPCLRFSPKFQSSTKFLGDTWTLFMFVSPTLVVFLALLAFWMTRHWQIASCIRYTKFSFMNDWVNASDSLFIEAFDGGAYELNLFDGCCPINRSMVVLRHSHNLQTKTQRKFFVMF